MSDSVVYIDADACPVKDETFRVAGRYSLKTFVVSNGGMRPSRDPMIETVVVAAGADIADDWIAERCGEGDVVITADIPLAKRCIDAGAEVLGPTGKLFSKENIGMALAVRDLNQQLRESGEIKGYNAPFSRKDRSDFLNVLDRLLSKLVR